MLDGLLIIVAAKVTVVVAPATISFKLNPLLGLYPVFWLPFTYTESVTNEILVSKISLNTICCAGTLPSFLTVIVKFKVPQF